VGSKKTHWALVIGHSQRRPGAVNLTSGINEFEFNKRLAQRIGEILAGCTAVDISLVYRRSYRRLPDDINRLQPDYCLSLHCNAFDTTASGTQTLYYHTSPAGKALAMVLQCELVDCLGLSDRGVAPVRDNERGSHVLKYTQAPCVIAEPFFIDNNGDLHRALERFDELARTYARFICGRASYGCTPE